MGVNTSAVVTDGYLPNDGLPANIDDLRVWNGDIDVATYVGPSYWSMEYRLNYRQPEVPQPQRGTIWGFNFARTYRGKEYTQWVRVYGRGVHSPNDFGVLLFR